MYAVFHLALQYVVLDPFISKLDPRFKKLPGSDKSMLVATVAAMVSPLDWAIVFTQTNLTSDPSRNRGASFTQGSVAGRNFA